jgi:TatD DNase family protein
MTISLNRVRGFDFHCHVDLHPDPVALMSRCEAQGIITVAVTTTPKAWPKNVEWSARCDYVLPAVGLHPELAGQRHTELPLLINAINDSRLIGEVGLDGSPQHKTSVTAQREVFRETLKAAQSLGGRVLTIHSRRAANEVIDMIDEHTTRDRVLCILHWFTGSASSAKRAVDLGCFFSVNGRMLENERSAALVRALPPQSILTETDAPFAGEGSSPWDVVRTADRLASLLGTDGGRVIERIMDNSVRVLRFAGVEAR